MSSRKIILTVGETYHTYNRSVANEEFLKGKKEERHLLGLLDYYRFPQKISFSKFRVMPKTDQVEYLDRARDNKPLVQIFAFSLMPDHFHLLLRQETEKGISAYVSNIQNSFAKYYNARTKRHGSLFQNPFKAKRVETNEQLIHLSRYIHLNPVTAYLIKLNDLFNYPRTSYSCYLSKNKRGLVETNQILDLFRSTEQYAKFVLDQVDYQRKLAEIKKFIND